MSLVLPLVACGEDGSPPVPGEVVAANASSFNAVAGVAVPSASRPSVLVTTTSGNPIGNVDVTFEVVSGGGSVTGAPTVSTNGAGIATVGGWQLGATAGTNELHATVEGLAPVIFTATGTAGAAARLAVIVPPSTTAINRVVLATQPVVEVRDANHNLVTASTAVVTASIFSGTGSVAGTVSVPAVAGVATFTDLSIAGPVGLKTLGFGSPALISTTAPALTTSPGAAALVLAHAGGGQVSVPGGALPIAPSVRVTDPDQNGVPGVTVQFAVTEGGGNVATPEAVTDAAGIAVAGVWTLGNAEGSNALSVTAAGVGGAPLVVTAEASASFISAVAPATLTSDATATITGAGFSATIAGNAVTIDGVAAVVVAASPTALTVTVPWLPCTPAHNAVVGVSIEGAPAITREHPVRAATVRQLAPGQSIIISTAVGSRCNELPVGGGEYYLNVFNTNQTYSTTPADFWMKGTPIVPAGPGVGGSVITTSRTPRRAAAPTRRTGHDLPGRRSQSSPAAPSSVLPIPSAREDRAHLQLLERHLAFLRENGPRWRQRQAMPSLRAGAVLPHAVGDPYVLRIGDLNSANYCQNYLTVNGRVAYAGTRAIIVEDTDNPLSGQLDTTYSAIGAEFDNLMWGILETNFGNALVNDASLDNNGRLVMVFTNKVRGFSGGGIAGFVSPCDYFDSSIFASSNEGEFFYANAPLTSGTILTPGSPPNWAWTMRSTVIHEVKHIVSTGERFFRNGGTAFEESWLEESSARIAEELYERARYAFAQRANIGYATNGGGPHCGVRACGGQPRGIVRVFEELASRWYSMPGGFSPLGRIDDSDFSFYATAWSLLRWSLDADSRSEATILKALTQAPTNTGLANFDAEMQHSFQAALPRWTSAMILDEMTNFTPADATLRMPSWNLRNVYAGYDQDFNVPWVGWPHAMTGAPFGSFLYGVAVRPGTATIQTVWGTQTHPQLLELMAGGGNAAAPAELRLMIVRVQ